MSEMESVIGLEVHARLATNTKLFCSCSASYGSEPNTHVCEICAGMPGVLPVVNAKAVEYAVRAGLAVGCKIVKNSIFARKNYFYPDLPAGYQISQFDLPICEGGQLDIKTEQGLKSIGITRIHLENDAGKNIHSEIDQASYVDLNRAGVPLIEIVSEPDLRSADEAVAYLKELHSIVTALGICDGNMEEGSFRCDANVSIRPKGQKEFGTRAELKNLNSFKNVKKAIEYEIERQKDVLDEGKKVIQETRLFDSVKNITQSMRSKEEAHDYRYFPDPDLPPLYLTDEQIQAWQKTQPELAQVRSKRLIASHGLGEADAMQLCSDRYLADLFEQSCELAKNYRLVLNFIFGALQRELNQRELSSSVKSISPQALAELVNIVDEGLISSKIANDIFSELFGTELMPRALVQAKGLIQVSDTQALVQIVDEVMAANPKEVAAYAKNNKLISFFIGQAMRASKGKANPNLLTEIFQEKLNKI